MKLKTLSATAALGLSLLFTYSVRAQDPAGGGGARHSMHERLANLTPEEKAKLKSAHKTAMEDPAVQAAREKFRQARQEFRESMHAAMIKADPSVQPILDKIPKRHGDDDDGAGG